MAALISQATTSLKKGTPFVTVVDNLESLTKSRVKASWIANQALRALKGVVA